MYGLRLAIVSSERELHGASKTKAKWFSDSAIPHFFFQSRTRRLVRDWKRNLTSSTSSSIHELGGLPLSAGLLALAL
jgi:hypothetical protein